jgi:15-cis-phytoene synthase
MTPAQYVQEKAAASGSSFYYAFLFLPPLRRAAITAFYAFCREVDDVVDEARDASVAATKLAWWQAEVQRAYAGQASHPVMLALMPLAADYGISAAQLQAIIRGCQMDLEQTRYLDFAALQQYCHLVAGVVGEVAAQIFGRSQPQTTQYAHTLGQALQLTNIIRDVGEDASRGRIYIPINEMQRFDVKAHEVLKCIPSARFSALMAFQAERAQGLYAQALAMLPDADRRSQKPGLMMASIYRTLLTRIEARGFPVLTERVRLSPLRKFWLAWQVQALGRM